MCVGFSLQGSCVGCGVGGSAGGYSLFDCALSVEFSSAEFTVHFNRSFVCAVLRALCDLTC